MKNYRFLRMFLSPDGGQGGDGTGNGSGSAAGSGSAQQNQTGQQSGQAAQAFDYEKLASIIAGKQTVTEDTVLKSYFKNQGLSQEEAQQAMAAFKAEKAKNTPDISGMQTQLAQAQATAQQAQLKSEATMAAVGLGIDAKTIPYVLKMADLSQVIGQDGKINTETLNNALNKVLEDVPALKPQAAGSGGFIQVGAGSATQQQSAIDSELDRIFGTKNK